MPRDLYSNPEERPLIKSTILCETEGDRERECEREAFPESFISRLLKNIYYLLFISSCRHDNNQLRSHFHDQYFVQGNQH